MAIVAPASSGGRTPFELCPPGPQQLVCCDVVDHGLVAGVGYDGQPEHKHKVTIKWQSEHKMRTGKPYLVQRRYTFSMHEKASLRIALSAWRGTPFTDEQARTFDLERLIGVNAYANVVHKDKGPKGVFAEVMSLMPKPKALPKLTVESYVRVTERKAGEPHEDGPVPGEADDSRGGDTSFPPRDEPEFS